MHCLHRRVNASWFIIRLILCYAIVEIAARSLMILVKTRVEEPALFRLSSGSRSGANLFYTSAPASAPEPILDFSSAPPPAPAPASAPAPT